jgi:integrase
LALSIAAIHKLAPKARRYMVSDAHGLAIEVMRSGTKAWRFEYRQNRKHCVVGLGRFPAVSLADARAKRDELTAAIRAGESPTEKRRKERDEALKSVTVREFAERYYAEVVETARKHPETVRRYLLKEVYPALGSMPLSKVNAQDMQEIIFTKKAAGHGQAAVAIRNLLKRIWDYAIVRGAATANPAKATPVKFIAKANKRTRNLSDPEIGIFLRALDRARIAKRYRTAFLIILLTLVRKSELRLARWEHIDLDKGEWLIPAENAKNGKELLIFLSRQAIALFTELCCVPHRAGGYVMPTEKSFDQPLSANRLNQVLAGVRTGLPHYTIHDLRRTGSTRLNEMEFNELWVEKALNHSKKGVSGIYNRAEYAKQRREMMQAWADHLDILRGFSY